MNAYLKNLLRQFKGTFGRFFSILIISMLGVGSFAGLRSVSPDMRLTADRYFDELSLLDLQAVSTLGFSDKDIQALRADDGLTVMPSYAMDALADGPRTERQYVVKLHAYAPDAPLNKPMLLSGRLPQAPGECVVSDLLAGAMQLQAGDSIALQSGREDPIGDFLSQDAYTVVGTVRLPLYVTHKTIPATVGDGMAVGFVMLPQANFITEVYTAVYMGMKGAAELDCGEQPYKDMADAAKGRVEAVAAARQDGRYQEIMDEAGGKIADAEKELADGEREREEKLADARRTMQDAQVKIDDGQKELDEGRAELQDELAKAMKKLKDAEREIADGQRELDDSRIKLEDGEVTWQEGKAEYDQGVIDLEDGRVKLEEGREEIRQAGEDISAAQTQIELSRRKLDATKPQLESAKQQLDAGAEQIRQLDQAIAAAQQYGVVPPPFTSLQALIAARDSADAQYRAGEAQYRDGLWQYQKGEDDWMQGNLKYQDGLRKYRDGVKEFENKEAEFRDAEAKLADAKAELADGRAELDDGWRELNRGQVTLDDGRADLRQGYIDYDKGKQEGEEKIADAQQKLDDGRAELADGQREYDEQEAESGQKIADAHKELADAKQELADLDKPKWYVSTRAGLPSYQDYYANAERIAAIGVVFPMVFFVVAVLISLTTMTRMVDEQRAQIGAMKMMGYSKAAIAMKYVIYAFLASALGSAGGMVLGQYFFPSLITNAYGMAYNLPPSLLPFQTRPQVMAVSLCIGIILLSAVNATRAELHETPANLLRPKAPSPGKRILLERIAFVWNRTPFSWKVSLRNLFRYKQRFLMTILGISGCTALLLTGFGIKDSLGDVPVQQFQHIWHYDAFVPVDVPKLSVSQDGLSDLLLKNGATDVLWQRQESVTCASSARTVEPYLLTAGRSDQLDVFGRMYTLRTFPERQPLSLTDGGVIVSVKLARLLSLSPGSTLAFTDADNNVRSATVLGVTENYVEHYMFMTDATYESIYGRPPVHNAATVFLSDTSQSAQSALAEKLLAQDGVLASIFTTDKLESVRDMFEQLNIIVYVLVASAGALAFAVLYNLTNINIAERVRELATIKVLGFTKREVSDYIMRESFLLTLIGIGVGLVLGVFLHRFVMQTAEVDMILFSLHISKLSYALAGALTLLFASLVFLLMRPKLNGVNMVESLKSVE